MAMRCPKCGADNREVRKFCAKCAAPLPRPCPQCGASNELGEDFCGECGTALGVSAAAGSAKKSSDTEIRVADTFGPENLEGERKTITALFADIKGSMDLIETLDPEEARAIFDPALKLMMDAAHRYGGYVAQSTGDGILALFGAPLAHEDHPQRALYAALRMQNEMQRYSAKLREDGHPPVEARVGVNTGEVVMRSLPTGAGGHTEYVPVGHSISLAARMEVLAPVGSIATTQEVKSLCEGYFLFKPLGPTRVKGVTDPVNLYEVTGQGSLRTHFQLSTHRGLTRFVGRGAEMETIEHAAELAKAGHGQLVCVVAEPGVGKSRLFYEFKAKNQSGWMVLEAFSVSHGRASAFQPVIDLLHSYFRIAPEDDTRTRREKVNGKVPTLDRKLEDALPYLFGLLGLVEGDDPLAGMDARIRRERTLEALKRVLLRESLNQPLMVIFEDLHWIDEETQAFLNLLADSIGTAKLLLLATYRPEYSHQWSGKTYYIQLRLDPLGKEPAGEMFDALLGANAQTIDASLLALKRLIIEKTEGTPLFMEEIYHALMEQGALARNGAVKLTRPLDALKIPTTVQAILASRIDGLPAAEKELLQTLAVIGIEFPLALAREVTGKPDEELNRILDDLQFAEFVYEQPAVGGIEYTFKHALTHEVAYNSVLVERRKTLHERAGQALESMFPQHLSDHLDDLAHHYSRSGNLTKAIDYLHRAGEQAVHRSAMTQAARHFTYGLELISTLPEGTERLKQELLLQSSLGNTLVAIKGFSSLEVGRVLARARELSQSAGQSPQLFQILWGQWINYAARAEHEIALELAEQCLRLAQDVADTELLIEAHHALVVSWIDKGDFLKALEHVDQAIAVYDPEHHQSNAYTYGQDPAAICQIHAGHALWSLGYPNQAVRRTNEGLSVGRRLVHPRNLATIGTFAALNQQFCRNASAVAELVEPALKISSEYNFTYTKTMGTILNGWALTKMGCLEDGIVRMQEGLEVFRTTDAVHLSPYFSSLLAEAQGEAGRPEQGLDLFAGLDPAREPFWQAELHRVKGELILSRAARQTSKLDSETEAENCFRQALAIAQRQRAKSFELRGAMSLSRLLLGQGRSAEAYNLMTNIYNWFTEGFDTADLKDAKVLLEELSSR